MAGVITTMLLVLWAAPAGAPAASEWRREVESGRRARLQPQTAQGAAVEDALLASRGVGSLLANAAGYTDSRQQPDVLLLQARWAMAEGRPGDAMQFASRLVDAHPESPLHDQAQYVLAQAEMSLGGPEAAERRMDWLSRHGRDPWRGWGLYGQAQAALARGDTTEALRVLRIATSLANHEAVGPALLRLGQLHDVRGEAARAVRYLTLYREACPNGITPLLEHAVGESSRADAAAGVTYAVQVGVFADAANARRQKEAFSGLGYRIELKRKRLAGSRYTAVWVGQFRTRERALEVRRELEKRFGETYRVVVHE